MSINAETGHQTQASIGGRILRMRDLRERLGLTASHIYAMVAAGRFPKPFPIIPGGRATGWLESTIDAYLTNCSTAAPEPVAYFDPQKREFYWARPTQIDAPTTVDVPPLPLYAAPPPAAPEPESKTPAWWMDGLAATLMREGVNKHRAREIAVGYWEAYCQIPGNEENKA